MDFPSILTSVAPSNSHTKVTGNASAILAQSEKFTYTNADQQLLATFGHVKRNKINNSIFTKLTAHFNLFHEIRAIEFG